MCMIVPSQESHIRTKLLKRQMAAQCPLPVGTSRGGETRSQCVTHLGCNFTLCIESSPCSSLVSLQLRRFVAVVTLKRCFLCASPLLSQLTRLLMRSDNHSHWKKGAYLVRKHSHTVTDRQQTDTVPCKTRDFHAPASSFFIDLCSDLLTFCRNCCFVCYPLSLRDSVLPQNGSCSGDR